MFQALRARKEAKLCWSLLQAESGVGAIPRLSHHRVPRPPQETRACPPAHLLLLGGERLWGLTSALRASFYWTLFRARFLQSPFLFLSHTWNFLINGGENQDGFFPEKDAGAWFLSAGMEGGGQKMEGDSSWKNDEALMVVSLLSSRAAAPQIKANHVLLDLRPVS